jgi:hypothetical protein
MPFPEREARSQYDKPQTRLDRFLAGLSPHAPKRTEKTTFEPVDESFRANPERRMASEEYMSLVHGCALIHPEECQDLKYVMHIFLDGWKLADVAKAMGVSRYVAQKRIDETLVFLKEFILEQEQET